MIKLLTSYEDDLHYGDGDADEDEDDVMLVSRVIYNP